MNNNFKHDFNGCSVSKAAGCCLEGRGSVLIWALRCSLATTAFRPSSYAMRYRGERGRLISTHFRPQCYIKLNSYIHAPAALSPESGQPVLGG